MRPPMDTTAAAPATVCTGCRSAPPMVVGMSHCKACLRHQVAAERSERERRMLEPAKDQRHQRREIRPIGRADK
jgi:hypothetical protein